MKVIYCTRKWNIFSILIRLFTMSKFSHVVIVENDNTAIESTFAGGGVNRIDLDYVYKTYDTIEEVNYQLDDEEGALNFVTNQIGKPYDWTIFVSFLFNRDWGLDDAWFCNELMESGLKAGGRKRFRDGTKRITPKKSYEVL